MRVWVHFLFLGGTLLLFSSAVCAEKIAYREAFSLEYKQFEYAKGENLGLYGARRIRFLDEHWYWGEAGYGAVAGSRSGYIEGGFVGGFRTNLTPQWVCDASFFLGAGGGGRGDHEGSGLILYSGLMLAYQSNSDWLFGYKLGNMKYLNGNLESTWTGIEISRYFDVHGAITKENVADLKKNQVRQHFVYEYYLNGDETLKGAMGYYHDFFFAKDFYASVIVYGAVSGIRGGYGVGAVGIGQLIPLTEKLSWNTRVFCGSGGDRYILSAGGFVLGFRTGLEYAINKAVGLESNIGYLSFPNAALNIPVVNLGISYRYDVLN